MSPASTPLIKESSGSSSSGREVGDKKNMRRQGRLMMVSEDLCHTTTRVGEWRLAQEEDEKRAETKVRVEENKRIRGSEGQKLKTILSSNIQHPK